MRLMSRSQDNGYQTPILDSEHPATLKSSVNSGCASSFVDMVRSTLEEDSKKKLYMLIMEFLIDCPTFS